MTRFLCNFLRTAEARGPRRGSIDPQAHSRMIDPITLGLHRPQARPPRSGSVQRPMTSTTVRITRDKDFDPIDIATTTESPTGTTVYVERFLRTRKKSLTSGDDLTPGKLVTTTPDLTSLPFWKPRWNLAVDGKAVTEVTAWLTVYVLAGGGQAYPRATRRITVP